MQIKKNAYVVTFGEDGAFDVYTADERLLFLRSSGVPMLPVAGMLSLWGKPTMSMDDSGENETITFSMPSNSLYDSPKVTLVCKDDFIEFFFTGKVKRRTTLDKWYLLPKGSEIKAIECVDFRSHIDSPDAYQVHQTVLGRRKLGTIGLDVSTEDSDLMFAPHPMLFVFQHFDDRLILGPMSLMQAESCHCRMAKGSTIIETYHIEVGANVYWLEEGETLESPHFMISMTQGKSVFEALEMYTTRLVNDGRIQPRKATDMQPWWYSPMWCSWGDQHTMLDSGEVVNLAQAEARAQMVHNINEAMVKRAVAVIEENQLPIRTLIIDDRWYTKQGDMYADTDKFPDMRGMVDWLHDKGFRVICWASLYQFWDEDSVVMNQHPEWFVQHHYHRNVGTKTDWPHLDYSRREVRDAYLGELMSRLLGDGPSGYNLDGIKFDWPFLIPHNYPYPDREWVGKETTIYRTQKAVYDAAKAVKQDALVIGVSPHPFFGDTQDVIRTYDVSTFDYRIHTGRAQYIKAVSPGMVPALDEHVFYQNFFEFIEEGSKLGIPMIYNLMLFNGDGVAYTEEDYRRLKRLLDDYVMRIPALEAHIKRAGQ